LRFGAALLFFLALIPCASAQQNVLQGGTTLPPVIGHLPVWLDDRLIGDSGPASGNPATGGITDLNVTNNTGIAPLCLNDAPTTTSGGWHQTCLGSNVSGQGGSLKYVPKGGATALPYTIEPTGALVLNSGSQQIVLKNLPRTIAGDVPVCVNTATGQLYQGTGVVSVSLLTDDNDTHLLTDDNDTHLLTTDGAVPQCVTQ
jgi:hypothetical protein